MSERLKLAVPTPVSEPPPAVAAPIALSLVVPEPAPTAEEQQPPAAHGPSPQCVEVLGFGARLLTELPLATTLVCRRRIGGGQLVVTTSRAVWEACKRARVPAFVGGELWVLTLAAEHERASPVVLEQWCTRKVDEPAWRLTVDVAVGPVFDSPIEARGWTVGQALRAFGVELVDVCLEDELPSLLEQRSACA